MDEVTIGWLCVLYEGGEVLQMSSLLYIYSPRHAIIRGCRVAAAQPSPSQDAPPLGTRHSLHSRTSIQIERTDGTSMHVPLASLFVLGTAYNRTKGPASQTSGQRDLSLSRARLDEQGISARPPARISATVDNDPPCCGEGGVDGGERTADRDMDMALEASC